MTKDNISEGVVKLPKIRTAIAWSMFFFWFQLASGMWDSYYNYFYVNNLQLPVMFAFAAVTIYTIFDAINEPLVGFFTDRVTKHTRKRGKRRRWIIIGGFIAVAGFVLFFLPPSTDGAKNPWPVFIWMAATMCIYDLGMTMSDTNMQALFPDKFRAPEARQRIQAWVAPISMVTVIFASILPTLFILNENDPRSYLIFAISAGALLFVAFLAAIPGTKEEKHVIDRYYNVKEECKETFFQQLKNSFKQKAFVLMTFIILIYFTLTGAVQGSMPFMFTHIIPVGKDSIIPMIVSGLIFMFGTVSCPVWTKIFKKINDNKKSLVITMTFMAIVAILVGCTWSITSGLVFVSLFGISLASLWMLIPMIMGDVFDERSVLFKTSQRGGAVGIMQFLLRFARFIMIGLQALIFTLAGFDATLEQQTSSAVFGIRLQAGIVPGILLLIAIVIWYRLYPLTKERTLEVQKELKDLDI